MEKRAVLPHACGVRFDDRGACRIRGTFPTLREETVSGGDIHDGRNSDVREKFRNARWKGNFIQTSRHPKSH